MVVFQRGSNFFEGWGGKFFQGGGGGGVQMLISIETHITCDFPVGSRPLSPLGIRTCIITFLYPVHPCSNATKNCWLGNHNIM